MRKAAIVSKAMLSNNCRIKWLNTNYLSGETILSPGIPKAVSDL